MPRAMLLFGGLLALPFGGFACAWSWLALLWYGNASRVLWVCAVGQGETREATRTLIRNKKHPHILYLYQEARLTCIMKAFSPCLDLCIFPPAVVALWSSLLCCRYVLARFISELYHVAEDAGWLNRKMEFPERRNKMRMVSAP